MRNTVKITLPILNNIFIEFSQPPTKETLNDLYKLESPELAILQVDDPGLGYIIFEGDGSRNVIAEDLARCLSQKHKLVVERWFYEKSGSLIQMKKLRDL